MTARKPYVEVDVTQVYRAWCGEPDCGWRGTTTGAQAQADAEAAAHAAQHLAAAEPPPEPTLVLGPDACGHTWPLLADQVSTAGMVMRGDHRCTKEPGHTGPHVCPCGQDGAYSRRTIEEPERRTGSDRRQA